MPVDLPKIQRALYHPVWADSTMPLGAHEIPASVVSPTYCAAELHLSSTVTSSLHMHTFISDSLAPKSLCTHCVQVKALRRCSSGGVPMVKGTDLPAAAPSSILQAW